mmetsp:Transcript_56362/g.104273  ORF Transcript_56362/g.104273 Transcript_56362/m.104273 type:complete len:588 (-) Transcript_56362:33-1796(-)
MSQWIGFCCRSGKGGRASKLSEANDAVRLPSKLLSPAAGVTAFPDQIGQDAGNADHEWWDEEWWDDGMQPGADRQHMIDDQSVGLLGGTLPDSSAVVAANADTVLQTALSSGDAALADAALGVGLRMSSVSWLASACSDLYAAGIPVRLERALDLVHVYSQEARPDLALDLFWQHQQQRTEISAELYGAILEACARCNGFALAVKVAEAASWQAPEDTVGQSAMLALVRWMAQQQSSELQARAQECYAAVKQSRGGKADVATHRILMSACVQAGDMDGATGLFRDLLSSGQRPDSSAFATLICGHCAAGHVQQALACFQMMKQHGIEPHVSLFNTLLDGCLLQNLPSLLEQVLADMEDTGVQPSTDTLAILLRHYGRNHGPDGVRVVLEEFPRDHGLELDAQAYSALILACLDAGCDDLAWKTFERCQSAAESTSDSLPTRQAYEAMIRSCVRHGHLERAVDLLVELLTAGSISEQRVSPDGRVDGQTTPRSVNEQNEPQSAGATMISPALLEDVLQLIGRRRAGKRMGIPLMQTLQTVGITVPEELAVALTSQADAEDPSNPSNLELRRREEEWRRWRDFKTAAVQ